MVTNLGGKGIGGHTKPFKGGSNIWLTPPFVLDALGKFDLDPCACSLPRPWETASTSFTIDEDGLSKHWFGRVILNPPYGNEAIAWMKKLSEHNNGIAILFARTETKMFFDYVWPCASSLFFLKGRLTFHRPDGSKGKTNSGGPSVLISYGKQNADSLRDCGLEGKWVRLQE